MRLIDADELCKNFGRTEGCQISCMECESFNCTIGRVVKAAPTIEAEAVKRGQWIHHAGMNSKCSCCGRYFPVAEFEQRPFDVNFCIHCGAKMDGGAD